MTTYLSLIVVTLLTRLSGGSPLLESGEMKEENITESHCKSSPCGNMGIFVACVSTDLCLCPLGYTGPNCDKDMGSLSLTDFKYADVNMKDGGIIKCKLDISCEFILFVQAKRGIYSLPNIFDGEKHGDIQDVIISTIVFPFTQDIGVHGLTPVPVTLKVKKEGLGKICFKLVKNKFQTVCYHVHTSCKPTVQKGVMQSFKLHNLPNGSTLLCNDICHLLVETIQKPNGECPQVQVQGNASWTFPSVPDIGECITEVVYSAAQPDSQLCIEAGKLADVICYTVTTNITVLPTEGLPCGDTTSPVSDTTTPMETTPHSLSTHSVPPDSTKYDDLDRCFPIPCRNRGECHGTVTGFNCKCQGQWSGPNCNIDNGMLAATSTGPPFDLVWLMPIAVGMILAVACCCMCKKCVNKCLSKKVAEVSPVEKLKDVSVEEQDEDDKESADDIQDTHNNRRREKRQICEVPDNSRADREMKSYEPDLQSCVKFDEEDYFM